MQRVRRQLSYGGLRAFSSHGVVSPRVVHADEGHVRGDDWSDDEWEDFQFNLYLDPTLPTGLFVNRIVY